MAGAEECETVQQFLGLTNYFRKFIQGHAALAVPLRCLRSWKKVRFCKDLDTITHGSVRETEAGTGVRSGTGITGFWSTLHSRSLRMHLSWARTGAVLLQNDQPIAYTSKRYIPAEINYTTTEQEMLAIVRALKEWRCYLEGSEVTLLTDHEPNTYFDTKPILSRRMARWVEDFDYKWVHKKGC
jgi:hypothetical protein